MLKNKRGFTLIELLIVVAIIAILAAIAIPQFAQYRIKGYNSSAVTDIRNMRTSEEALFAEFQRYGHSAAAALPGPGTCALGAQMIGPGVAATPNILTLSDAQNVARGIQTPTGNNVSMVVSTDAACSSYTGVSKHKMGDTAYGADSDSTATFSNKTLIAIMIGADVTAGLEPAPVAGTDEFSGVGAWTAM